MSCYSLYVMSPFTGHIERVIPIEAADDAAATTVAKGHSGDRPRELWCEHRKVLRLEAEDPANETIKKSRERGMWEKMISEAAEEAPLHSAAKGAGEEPKSASACSLWPSHSRR